MTKLQLERGQLENDLLRSQIARLNGQIGPAMPTGGSIGVIPGQGNSTPTPNYPMPGVQMQDAKVTASAPGVPGQEAGIIPDFGYSRTNTGFAVVPSKDMKERMEDMPIQEAMWAARNQIIPNFGMARPPAGVKLPYGHSWVFDMTKQEWQMRPNYEDVDNRRSQNYSKWQKSQTGRQYLFGFN